MNTPTISTPSASEEGQESRDVLVLVEGDISIIRLNRPQARNAFGPVLRRQLAQAVDFANKDTATRVVIIEAVGAGFSAGADLLEEVPDDFDAGREIEALIKPAFMAIMNSPKPYIAAVNGAAVGVGCGLAMACDLIFMAEDGFFLFPFAGLGLAPDGGTSWHLVRQLGHRRAFDILTGGRRIGAQECLALGLVNAVVAPEDLSKVARERAGLLAASQWQGLAFAKYAVAQAARLDAGDLMSLEGRLQSEAFASDEFKAAVKAFRSARG